MLCLLIMSIFSQTNYWFRQFAQSNLYGKVLVKNLHSAYLQMTNLRIDKMVFFRYMTKIGTDENKAIYSNNEFIKIL